MEKQPGSSGPAKSTPEASRPKEPKTRPAVEETTGPEDAPESAEAGPSKGKVALKTLGDFRLVKKLGAGGMGTIYKAHQISLDREVALKVLSKHLAENPGFIERFKREARLMARLEHPHILPCYAVGEEHGFHYFAMEFADGGSMEVRLKQLGRLNVGDALHVILACARALDHAHAQQLIHRDIKPGNILLTGKGVVKVADLGLAKALDEDVSLTRTGTGAGTPVYMSPEQARDAKHVDGRSDIHSLGCMLYCFLTGQPPFTGETLVQLVEAKEKGKFAPARRLNDQVPERLDLIIDKMVARNPDQRYQTCAELIKDLEGLGLANGSLSFLKEKNDAEPEEHSGPATQSPAGRPSRTRTGEGERTGLASAASEADAAGRDYWYVSFTQRDGSLVTRKLTTEQIRNMIRDDKHFDLEAQASRTRDGNYRALASYKEFTSALGGRLAKARADRKSAKFHAAYAKLTQEAEQIERRRWYRNLFRGAAGWVTFFAYIAIVLGVIFGGYLLIRFVLAPYLEAWWQKMIS
jgi:serine/threonine-protein kinase